MERQVLFNFFNALEFFGNLAFLQCLSSTSCFFGILWQLHVLPFFPGYHFPQSSYGTFPDIVLSHHGDFFYLHEGLTWLNCSTQSFFGFILTQLSLKMTGPTNTAHISLTCQTTPKLPPTKFGSQLENTLLLRGTFHPGFLEANHPGQPGRLPPLWPRQCSEWSLQHSGPVAPPKSHGLADRRRKVGDIFLWQHQT